MKILPAEPGLYFFASFESGAHVYKVVAWSENENGGLDPQCVLTALYDKSSSSQQWELHSTSASAYQHSNDGRPFMYFITYFTSNGGIPELYNAINTLAEQWGYPLIDLP